MFCQAMKNLIETMPRIIVDTLEPFNTSVVMFFRVDFDSLLQFFKEYLELQNTLYII